MLGAVEEAVAALSPRTEQSILEALRSVEHALTEARLDHMVIGGIAVIAQGVPRHTDDIDATVWAEPVDVDSLIGVLASNGIEPRIDDAREFAMQNQVLLLRHIPTGTPMEISLSWLPFEREALERAEVLDFAGVKTRVATPEDIGIFKAVAWRDRDRSDIEKLLVRHGARMNLERIRSVVEQFSAVLEEPERMSLLEEIIARALGAPPRDR